MKDLFFTTEAETAAKVVELTINKVPFCTAGRKHVIIK